MAKGTPKRPVKDLLVPRPAIRPVPRDVTAAVGVGGNVTPTKTYEMFQMAPEATQVVESGPGYTVMKDPLGRQFRAEGPRPWRNKNPGNIKTVTSFAKDHGAIGEEDGYAVFPTEQVGLQALRTLLFQPDSKFRNMNPTTVIEKFAPPEDANDTKAYQAFVNQRVGTNKPIQQMNPDQREALLNAILKFEGYPRGGSVQMAGASWKARPMAK